MTKMWSCPVIVLSNLKLHVYLPVYYDNFLEFHIKKFAIK